MIISTAISGLPVRLANLTTRDTACDFHDMPSFLSFAIARSSSAIGLCGRIVSAEDVDQRCVSERIHQVAA